MKISFSEGKWRARAEIFFRSSLLTLTVKRFEFLLERLSEKNIFVLSWTCGKAPSAIVKCVSFLPRFFDQYIRHGVVFPIEAENPLSELMKPLNSDYARYFNKKNSRRGYVFQDRYKSIATQDQFYVEQIIRYIQLNPYRAGICRSQQQFRPPRVKGQVL